MVASEFSLTGVNESLGVALTAKRAEQLFESGLDTVNISMDTLEPMKAEFITRRPSTFHKERNTFLSFE